ncbi:hypothetical protein GWI33_021717 [Rhynchophorus ferrugineus]|uniref:Cell cycle checkpoint control protein n=1 Tax=Rhynchophorus ferrugineus TaxID=354439 RepID=A0A834IQZ9_RHYFE|nr:hypothetical protein GWI33_021717 [Rhynchophorus ferrugineus]
MNCIIPGLNVKVLGRGIQALAKIGDELFIEAHLEKLVFTTFNQCKTVCARFHLLDSFFSQYDVKESELNEENFAVSCKIHMKTLLPLFKGTQLEKKLDYFKMEYDSCSDVIKFKIKYKCDDIIMSHVLCLMNPETLTIKNSSQFGNNNICATSSFYNNLLTLFSNSDDDITLEIAKNKVLVRNYCVGVPHKPKFVRSQVSLNSSEFSIFQVDEETTINFSLKPFRTAIHFADALNLNIGMYFEKGGKPLLIVTKNPTFEISFLVATLNPYSDGQSTFTAASLSTKITQVNQTHNITSEDLHALANENWEDFDDDDINKIKRSTGNSSLIKAPSLDLVTNNLNQTKERENEPPKKASKLFILQDTVIESKNNIEQKSFSHDLVPGSPESPRAKKAKFIFKRSFDPTYTASVLNIILPESDSE